MRNEIISESAITGNQALVEAILSSQAGEPMTAEGFDKWLASQA